jgi:hypothetical protein
MRPIKKLSAGQSIIVAEETMTVEALFVIFGASPLPIYHQRIRKLEKQLSAVVDRLEKLEAERAKAQP